MSHCFPVTQQIKAIDVWNPPLKPHKQEVFLNHAADMQGLQAEQLELQDEVERDRNSVKERLHTNLSVIADYYDSIWKQHDQVSDRPGYAIVNGLYDCPSLKQYISVCQKLEIGREISSILADFETIDAMLKSKDLRKAVKKIVSVDFKIRNTRVLKGFQSFARDHIDSLIDTCLGLIAKSLANGGDVIVDNQADTPSLSQPKESSLTFGVCITLFSLSHTLHGLKNQPIDRNMMSSVAHDLWFKLEKWKLPTPPDYKWLESECYTTSSAIFYNLENIDHTDLPSNVVDDFVSSGLEELFFRYLSYRSSDDIIYRASDFITNVIAVANRSPTILPRWRRLCIGAMQSAWEMAVDQSELVERAMIDKERILDQLKAKAELVDTCPVDGVEIQIKVMAAASLARQLIRRAELIMDESSLRTYLDLTLNEALVKTALDDLKYQWNVMDDPWITENLDDSFCIFNSVSFLYKSLLAEGMQGNSKIMEQIASTRSRIITLFLEELQLQDSSPQTSDLAGSSSAKLLSTAQASLKSEDMQEIYRQIPKNWTSDSPQ